MQPNSFEFSTITMIRNIAFCSFVKVSALRSLPSPSLSFGSLSFGSLDLEDGGPISDYDSDEMLGHMLFDGPDEGPRQRTGLEILREINRMNNPGPATREPSLETLTSSESERTSSNSEEVSHYTAPLVPGAPYLGPEVVEPAVPVPEFLLPTADNRWPVFDVVVSAKKKGESSSSSFGGPILREISEESSPLASTSCQSPKFCPDTDDSSAENSSDDALVERMMMTGLDAVFTPEDNGTRKQKSFLHTDREGSMEERRVGA